MKATDLMIGDWVYCYGKLTKIAMLTNADVITTEIGDGVITPIPLTAEILEKNGVMDKDKVSCQEMTKGLLYSRNENSYSISILFKIRLLLLWLYNMPTNSSMHSVSVVLINLLIISKFRIMKTIEERAIEYANKEWTFDVHFIANESYIAGANEQKAIDIDRACE